MNDAGETSILEPMGSFWKRVDDKPRTVEDGLGVGDRTCRKRLVFVGSGAAVDEKSSDGALVSGFSTVGAAGSRSEVMRTSCHPWCVFCHV